MMDLIVIAVAGAAVLLVVLAAIILLIRWRRNRFRFSIRSLLLLFALIGAALFALMRFVTPIVAHRWAIKNIYDSGGGLLFREDYNPDSSTVYSDKRKANQWRDVLILHLGNDQEAMTVASQLKRLPEAEQITLSSRVTDNGLAAICNNGMNSSISIVELHGSPVTAAGLSQLRSLKHFRTLLFDTCPIHESDLA
jgi:hypothetical protein